jgi:FAD/FMN-containing dehydrogenase
MREVVTDLGVRQSFARDASGLELVPESVARPTSEAEVVELLRAARADGVGVTAAGGQTSTTGASITDRGILLSLRELSAVADIDRDRLTVRVQAGANLGDLKRRLAAEGLLFAPDPTSEDDVTVGGAIACNASGARSLLYGATRSHIAAVRVALADGSVHELRRTRLEKNTVGYAPVHDPIDWFNGSEGTLGVILEAELGLLPLPPNVTGLAIPFPDESVALDFIIAARSSRDVSPRCLEYFDARALEVARTAEGAAEWASGAGALVYVEQGAAAGSEVPLESWLALAQHGGAAENDIVVYEGDAALRDARRLRHTVPSTMIERGSRYRAAGGRRVSTDWAVPYRHLREAISESRRYAAAAGIDQPVIYGHAGNGHPHQNFIARDAAELARMEQVVEQTLRHVVALGGTVAAEHGIGKIKRRWLSLQLTPLQLGVMHALKAQLDPAFMLAPGNLFEDR